MAEKSLYTRTVIKSSQSPTQAPVPKMFRGISTVGNLSKNYVLYDINLIKQDLVNHFHIRQGEKLERPEFGTIIWDLLFEPLTEQVKEAIAKNVTDIVNYDPRIKIDRVSVSEYESGIQIECDLMYIPYNITESLRFRFDQDNSIY